MEPGAAADALGILRDGQRHVRQEERRQQWLLLGVRAATTVLWMGRKDIRDPVRRRLAGAGMALGLVGLAVWEFDRSKVSTLWSERLVEQRPDLPEGETERRDPDPNAEHPPAGELLRELFSSLSPRRKRLLAASTAVGLARPFVVAAFRRSGIRYPHLAAGGVAAAMSTAVGVIGILTRPAADGD
ncbi:hypothetical protein [Microlunatus speluncae]|uniref:hypothetical protein n=1 Tax=Microlunatus speluncae TaxID=2594267 RepID=UPI001266237F|nr:hypothetical protein [Microlunatus speluncae]